MLKKLKVNFTHRDKRGVFIEIAKGKRWKQVNFFSIKKGHLRGGHYHKKTRELFFVIDGKCALKTVNIKNKAEKNIILRQRNVVVIRPYEAHYLKAIKDTKMLALLSVAHRKDRPDIYEI